MGYGATIIIQADYSIFDTGRLRMHEFNYDGACTLPDLGVIRATGDDAIKFLHGQLTQDLVLLPAGQARLAAYCNPKGRVLASFIVVKCSDQEAWLLCPCDLLGTTLKRLQMFVMRAKVQLRDASDDFHIAGLMGAHCEPLPSGTQEPWQAASLGNGAHVIQLYPVQASARQLKITLRDGATAVQSPAAETTLAWWQYGEVLSAVPWVGHANTELFVPQMLNYESVGGVNFKKGCYPGQEVVARSQFRGTLKRRLYLAQSSVELTPTQEIFDAADKEQPFGVVVAAARHPERPTQWVALLCLQTQSAHDRLVTAESSSDGVIQILPLPYPLRDDI